MAVVDYSVLDHPQISLGSFYPQRRCTATPQGAAELMVTMEDGVALSCRFFPCSRESPTVLFFYGNGEVASDYDDIAPLYVRLGINFFVADYRGYGGSQGSPSFGAMLADAHQVLHGLQDMLAAGHYAGPILAMGRSMGRHPAFELAAGSPDALSGLIVESGRPTLGQFVNGLDAATAGRLEEAYRDKVRAIAIPVLVIHGEQDTLAPVEQAVEMHHAFSSRHKRLVTIPGAGHNDLLYLGMERYFSALRDFVFWRETKP